MGRGQERTMLAQGAVLADPMVQRLFCNLPNSRDLAASLLHCGSLAAVFGHHHHSYFAGR